MKLTFVGSPGRTGHTPVIQSRDCKICFINKTLKVINLANDFRLNNASSSWLVFNGLDTFATIELCGQIVGTANNQFRQWQFDVFDALKSCKSDPIISLNFGSAPEIANVIANETGQESEY
jgi:beta-mannosidase